MLLARLPLDYLQHLDGGDRNRRSRTRPNGTRVRRSVRRPDGRAGTLA